jgi:hypothetical protein
MAPYLLQNASVQSMIKSATSYFSFMSFFGMKTSFIKNFILIICDFQYYQYHSVKYPAFFDAFSNQMTILQNVLFVP